MVDCRISGSEDDVGRPLTPGDDLPGRRQANEACNEEVLLLELLKQSKMIGKPKVRDHVICRKEFLWQLHSFVGMVQV